MKQYTLFWKNGKSEVVEGGHPSDAIIKAGNDIKTLKELSFYSAGDARHKWDWDREQRKWKSVAFRL